MQRGGDKEFTGTERVACRHPLRPLVPVKTCWRLFNWERRQMVLQHALPGWP